MHICFIGRHSMNPQFEENSLDAPIFKAFAKEFDHVSLIYRAPDNKSSVTQYGNITLHLVEGKGMLGFFGFVRNALKRTKDINDQLPIDVISTSDALGAGMTGVFAKKAIKIPLIVQIQGQTLKLPSESYVWIRRYITRGLARYVAGHADRVRVVSNEIKSQAIASGIKEQKIALIYNRCDTQLFDPVSKAIYGKQIRAELGIDNESTVISFIGRLESHKGIYELVEGISNLPGIKPHLLLIGDSPEDAKIEAAINKAGLIKSTHFVGKVAFNLIPNYLAATDIFVLPSKHEGTPRVILEAMAMEVPVIATKVGGIPEVIENGKTGILLENNNSESITNVLKPLIKKNNERRRIGKAARYHIVVNHNFNELAASLVDLHVSAVTEK